MANIDNINKDKYISHILKDIFLIPTIHNKIIKHNIEKIKKNELLDFKYYITLIYLLNFDSYINYFNENIISYNFIYIFISSFYFYISDLIFKYLKKTIKISDKMEKPSNIYVEHYNIIDNINKIFNKINKINFLLILLNILLANNTNILEFFINLFYPIPNPKTDPKTNPKTDPNKNIDLNEYILKLNLLFEDNTTINDYIDYLKKIDFTKKNNDNYNYSIFKILLLNLLYTFKNNTNDFILLNKIKIQYEVIELFLNYYIDLYKKNISNNIKNFEFFKSKSIDDNNNSNKIILEINDNNINYYYTDNNNLYFITDTTNTTDKKFNITTSNNITELKFIDNNDIFNSLGLILYKIFYINYLNEP